MSFLNSFFGGFLGSDKSQFEIDTPSHALSDLDLHVAIAAHKNWKNRLQTYLDGTSNEVFDAHVVCFDNRCKLGKWLHASDISQLGQYPSFTSLMSHHKMIHFAASKIVALHAHGKTAEAELIFKGQFTQFSKRVVDDLQSLSSMVANK